MAEWTWHEFLEWLDGCCCRGELPEGSCVGGLVLTAYPGEVIVRLDTARVVRAVLSPGSLPRPGQRVQVCADGVHFVDRRTAHHPRRPTSDVGDAFIPTSPSFDSPQFALGHTPPGVNDQAEFTGDTGTYGQEIFSVTLASGRVVTLPREPRANLQGGFVSGFEYAPTSRTVDLAADAVPCPQLGGVSPDNPQLDLPFFVQRGFQGTSTVYLEQPDSDYLSTLIWAAALVVTGRKSGGAVTRGVNETTLHFDGEVSIRPLTTLTEVGTLYDAELHLWSMPGAPTRERQLQPDLDEQDRPLLGPPITPRAFRFRYTYLPLPQDPQAPNAPRRYRATRTLQVAAVVTGRATDAETGETVSRDYLAWRALWDVETRIGTSQELGWGSTAPSAVWYGRPDASRWPSRTELVDGNTVVSIDPAHPSTNAAGIAYWPSSVHLQSQFLPPEPSYSRPFGERWRSPDGQVTVTGNGSGATSDLTDATLKAYGVTFTGGSWAALRDAPEWVPPTAEQAGFWRLDRVVILHEQGETVTAIRPGAAPEACDRSTFERECLRVPPGSFDHFSGFGLLSHSWPPQWALLNGERSVSVIAWDAWRDAIRRRPKPGEPSGPPSWYWPARPARRALRDTMPRPPLGVTAAGVTDLREAEALALREAPLRLPERVEVFRNGAWRVSEAARRALGKRHLYAPAGWPEELNDRTSVSGPLRVTFPAQADGPATLLLRARTGGRPLTLTVNGAALHAVRLGHNARERRGWHPYVLALPRCTPTLEITSNVPLSRLLLSRSTPDGQAS